MSRTRARQQWKNSGIEIKELKAVIKELAETVRSGKESEPEPMLFDQGVEERKARRAENKAN